MCAKGNPKFSCPTILSHSDDEFLGSESDSREELFDSSLDTVNVSVNTELPMNSSYGSEEEEFDFLHLYEELSDYDFHRMMSVDDFTYSTASSNEVFDNGEWCKVLLLLRLTIWWTGFCFVLFFVCIKLLGNVCESVP